MTAEVLLTQITRDPAMQSRASIDVAVVEEYAQAVREGVDFDPVDLVQGDGATWLVDGWHRTLAYEKAGAVKIPAVIRRGSRIDAIALACSANVKHGLKRTNEDKRRTVRLYLAGVVEHLNPRPTVRQIADHCGVGHAFVANMVREMEAEGHLSTVDKSSKRRGDRGPDAMPRKPKAPSSSGDGPRAPVTAGPEREPPTEKKPPDQGTDAPPRPVKVEPSAAEKARAGLDALDEVSRKAIVERAAKLSRYAKAAVAGFAEANVYVDGPASVITDHAQLRMMVASLDPVAAHHLVVLVEMAESLGPTIKACAARGGV